MNTDGKIDVPFRTQQFVIVAVQAGNFHKAARALGIDHSRIVRSIDRLERDLGVKIFDRTRQKFSVTRAGVAFVNEIREAINHVERACELARYNAHISDGPLRLGYSAFVHSKVVPVLERFGFPSQADSENGATQQSVDSKMKLACGTTIDLIERVMRGALHAALGVAPLRSDSLAIHPVAREPYCLAVSRNHRLARQNTLLAKELDGEPVFFIPRSLHPAFYDHTVDYIQSTGASPVFRETRSFTHTMEIVAHDFGVALLPRSAARFSHVGVTFKPISDKLLWIETVLFHPLDQEDNLRLKFLHELLSEVRRSAFDH
jgi:LysR family transcriptional regulator, benzoate and cis,cis-muconate-responsive activator of ben and cat genes